MGQGHSCMARSVRKLVHTVVRDRISGGLDDETTHEPLGYSSRSGRRPRRRAHPGSDCTRTRRIGSREEIGRAHV